MGDLVLSARGPHLLALTVTEPGLVIAPPGTHIVPTAQGNVVITYYV